MLIVEQSKNPLPALNLNNPFFTFYKQSKGTLDTLLYMSVASPLRPQENTPRHHFPRVIKFQLITNT